jgi:prevent-host-death family protein
MLRTAEADELAKRLPEYLDAVKAGHEVLVTQGNETVARLVPIRTPVRHRSIREIKPLKAKWIGEEVLKSGDLADEMFNRP